MSQTTGADEERDHPEAPIEQAAAETPTEESMAEVTDGPPPGEDSTGQTEPAEK